MKSVVLLMALLAAPGLLAFMPTAAATHVAGADVPPGANTATVAALIGQLGNLASSVADSSSFTTNTDNVTLPPGTYAVSARGVCSSGSPSAVGIRLFRNAAAGHGGSQPLALEIRRNIANSTVWFDVTEAAYISAAGIHYQGWNGTNGIYTYNFWFTTSQSIVGFHIVNFAAGCTSGQQRLYQNDVASDCSDVTGYAVRIRHNSVTTLCVVNLAAAVIPPPDVPPLACSAGSTFNRISWAADAKTEFFLLFNDTTTHAADPNAANYFLLGNYSRQLVEINGAADTHLNLDPGAQYYRMRAVNYTSGLDAISAEVTCTAGNPAPGWTEARAFREMAFLCWDDAGYTDPLNYFLYRGNSTENLTLYETLPADAECYRDEVLPGESWCYSVKVVNATGTSPFGDVVCLDYAPPPPPLFGEEGVVYGTEGKAALANSMQISTTSLDILYGLFFVVGLAITGFMATKPFNVEVYGSAGGAITGVFLAMGFGFWPVWAVLFLLAVGLAVFFMMRRRD